MTLRPNPTYGSSVTTRFLLEWLGFIAFIVSIGIIIYYDDIQLVHKTAAEAPTIYNIRIYGLKIVDMMAISLFILLVMYKLFCKEIVVTPFHKNIGMIFLVYCYGAIVGFIYSFFLRYDYAIWLQDFQQTIYMVGFALLTFYFLDTLGKWKTFVILFLVFLALKNVLIFYFSLTGVGKAIGDWAFRASQNSEFAYFPMMFFPLLVMFLTRKSFFLKLALAGILLIYVFNSLIGIYRTVWVMLLVGSVYLFFQLNRSGRLMLFGIMSGSLLVTLSLAAALFPKFLDLAWNYKFASIFDWSIYGDRSNSTRVLEILNVVNHVFSNFAFLQGMGLGAWWEDSARRLLPDLGSGFTYKTRFHTTHMWYVTQLLKIGIIAMTVYWLSIYKMYRRVSRYLKTMSWTRWEKSVILGLNIGLLCAFVSSADFVRLFLFIGVNLGLTSSFMFLDAEGNKSKPTT